VRVVSLVPSATETLLDLGVGPVACTRFCEQPGIPTVGGTKNPDVAAIVDLAPDLVVVNDEENRREDAEALTAAGLALHAWSPRTVAAVGPGVAALASAVGVDVPAAFASAAWAAWLDQVAPNATARPVVVFVWRRPWMTLGADTYAASVLAHLDLAVVAAGDADARYPTVTLEDVRAQRPELAILPSEPYPFAARHVGEVERVLPGVAVRLVDGRDLFWWGTRTPNALTRLRATLT
jgi:ABC-type Fe3+-hydroxamate transport system substrate-binding protein